MQKEWLPSGDPNDSDKPRDEPPPHSYLLWSLGRIGTREESSRRRCCSDKRK